MQSRESSIDLTVLTLNLHTYQESKSAGTDERHLTNEMAKQRIASYGPIFDRIAAGIDALDPDIICFQEVGEWAGRPEDDPESAAFGGTDSNMVYQILSRLGDLRYHYTMDWSHYGWQVWMEGSAILSKHPIAYSDSRFISSPGTSRHESWRSRNVPTATIDVPVIGDVAVYSVHAGWWDDPEEPAQAQFRRLFDWIGELDESTPTTILCGDFNAPAGGPAYRFVTTGTGFSDQYLIANPDGMYDATIGGDADGWASNRTDQRIDYILMNDEAPLRVSSARRVFTKADFGRVSDHVGIYAEFRTNRTR
jgi:maltose 6'-phosphate phosphatase